MSKLLRPCLDCGRVVRGKTRCWDCERAHDRARGTRQQRGYGAEHDQLRGQQLAALDPWRLCPRCQQPLGPDPARLDLMHTDDRTGWQGLGHRRCNRDTSSPISAGQRTPRPPKFPTHSAPEPPSVVA